MEQLDNITMTAVNRYFKHLSQLGYMNDGNVNKLLLLVYLKNFLHRFTPTEEDFRIILSKIKCLEQTSCLIPYESYIISKQPVKNYLTNTPVRITQDSDIRKSQGQDIRLVNQ